MAYAFHNKFGKGPAIPRQAPMRGPNLAGHQKHQAALPHPPHYRMDTSPQHVLNMSGQPMHQDAPSSGHGHVQSGSFQFQKPTREYPGHGEPLGEQQLQNRHELPGHNMLHQSARYSGQVFGSSPTGHPQQDRDEKRMSMLLAANERQPYYSNPQQQGHMATEYDKRMMPPMQLYSPGGQERQLHPSHAGGERDMLDTSRTSGKIKLATRHTHTIHAL